jgi:hypothetical protein
MNTRPQPVWRRHHPRVLRLATLHEEVLAEAAAYPRSSDVNRALNRAGRAIYTAVRLLRDPDAT